VGLKPDLDLASVSALTLVGWVIWPTVTESEMTCNVSSWTLSLYLYTLDFYSTFNKLTDLLNLLPGRQQLIASCRG